MVARASRQVSRAPARRRRRDIAPRLARVRPCIARARTSCARTVAAQCPYDEAWPCQPTMASRGMSRSLAKRCVKPRVPLTCSGRPRTGRCEAKRHREVPVGRAQRAAPEAVRGTGTARGASGGTSIDVTHSCLRSAPPLGNSAATRSSTSLYRSSAHVLCAHGRGETSRRRRPAVPADNRLKRNFAVFGEELRGAPCAVAV